MTRTIKYSCIIPFYNEGKRLSQTLDLISQCREIDQIICVDDGSTDIIDNKFKQNFPGIIFLRHSRNRGKTAAVNTGIQKASGEFIVLLDADLRKLIPYEIDSAIKTLIKQPEIDMIILRRIYAQFFTKMNRADVLFSGERILKKADLIAALNLLNPQKFEIEIALNKYMMDLHKTVRWLPYSSLNTYKMWKRGFPKGLFEDWAMMLNIFLYVGIIDYIKQMLFFCKEKAYSRRTYV